MGYCCPDLHLLCRNFLVILILEVTGGFRGSASTGQTEIALHVLDGRRRDEPEEIVDAGVVVFLPAGASSSSGGGGMPARRGHHGVGK